MQLVQVHGARDQACGKVDVGEDQVGCVHSAQRGHPHRGVGRVGAMLFCQLSAVGKHERVRLRRDREGILEDRIGEIHRGVAQAYLSCLRPAGWRSDPATGAPHESDAPLERGGVEWMGAVLV